MTAMALAYERSGPSGAPALLLGGSLGATRRMWDPQLPALGARLDTVAFDHRGHGDSPVPDGPYAIADLGGDVLALMDRLELARASYCGLSIGGMVGQWLAIHAPERIERLVLISTAAWVPTADAYDARAAAVRGADSAEVVADAVIERWFTPSWAESHPDLVAAHRAMVASTPSEGYAGCAEAVAGHDERAGLSRVRAPTLVVAGAQDKAIDPGLGAELADQIPGARFTKLDPGAHLPGAEQPARLAGLILEHVTGGDP